MIQSPMIEDYDKHLSNSNIIKFDYHKQSSIYQGTYSARYKNKVESPTVFDQESENQQDQWSSSEKIKLVELRQKLKEMKDRIRAQNLVKSLPSRMLKNLDQNKFNLLGDKTYNDEQIHVQQIALYDKRVKLEKKQQTIKQLTQTQNISQNSNIMNKLNLLSDDSQLFNQLKQPIRREKQKYVRVGLSRSLKNICKQILLLSEHIFNSIPIIQPSSFLKVIWDILYGIVVIISMFFLPISIVFDYNYSFIIPGGLIVIIPIILMLDILVNMNTGYFEKGQVVKSRVSIVYFYLKNNSVTDIISVIPFIISFYFDPFINQSLSDQKLAQNKPNWIQHPAYKIFLMFFFFKILSLSQIFRKIEERFNLSKRVTYILQLIKLLFTIILINHLFACLWVYVAKQEGSSVKTWMNSLEINYDQWYSQYITGYYYQTVTMSTVGYGDISPKNQNEMVLCVLTILIACCVFGYTLNEVGQIFSNFFQVQNEIKKKIGYIQRFMSKKNIDQKLQYEIREYLEYYWRETSEMNQEQEQHIVNQLSESLRSKLMYEANKIVFKDSPIFKRNFSKSTMEQIIPLIQEMKYTPETFICQEGIQDDASIYFIENGSVEVLLQVKDKKQRSLFTLKKGESFGAHTFFTGLSRVNNIRSKEFTTVLKIRRQDFLQLIQSNSEDYETFCSIRDSISYLNDYSKIGLGCFSCNSQQHLVNECQYLHYIPNKAKIYKLFNDQLNISHSQRQHQERRKINPKYYFKNSRVIFKEVLSQAEIFLDNYQSYINNSDDDSFSEGYFQSDYNENILQFTDDEKDNKYHYVENKTLNGKESAINTNQNAYVNQPRTLKSRQALDANFSQSINQFDIIEEDEQGENGNEILNLLRQKSDKQNQNKEDKQKQSKNYNQSPQISSNNGFQAIITNRTSSKRNTDTQFTLPSLYRSNTVKTEQQTTNYNDNGSSYSNHRQYQNTVLQQHSSQQNLNSNTALDEVAFQELLKQAHQINQMSPGSFKRNTLKQMTKKIMNAQKMFDSANRSAERRLSKQILLDELGSPTQSIKQQFQQNKKISAEKIVTKILQQKTTMNNESKELEQVLKQLQQLVLSQQNYQQLQQQLEISNQNNNLNLENIELDSQFDRMKQFVKYNPRFNFSSVISRYNQLLEAKTKKSKVKKQDRASKPKGSIYGKTSNKNLEFPTDNRKFSKFSPVALKNNMISAIQDGTDQNAMVISNSQRNNAYSESDCQSPTYHQNIQIEKISKQKCETNQNQSQNCVESMNYLKASNGNSSQIIASSPMNIPLKEPVILGSKLIEYKKNSSLNLEDKFNKSNSFNFNGFVNKYSILNKEETVCEDVNSPSLHILPNNFDMKFSQLNQRSILDFQAKEL
ncbi:cation channel family protein (macronuclear) [Tetrahymena thermophila SB210]|uniref:Cation channel family protein n=1 Tax=Tetrahymena thermophila (strain SB210) TaxID=312017 RepID=Q23AA4_TETTS|nr:cation channel family protein [Tetrahymena thermophila SB210]EAR93588.2 cation channel family protein [Tetrahymena thermophila SB210]|eukprot:XP_001013833.2 cation channel family protein [Tetrahymena thermophila SB210]